jgi:PLP dependent protein
VPVGCLLQVNVAGEDTKAGVSLDQVDGFLDDVAALERVRFHGLMTMPPLVDDPNAARPWFAALRELRDRLAPAWQGRHEFRELSMGTSQDYEAAAAEGATIVRVGSVLYGR